MPIPSQGAVPGGLLYAELAAVTHRAFIPKLISQIYFGSPSTYYMFGTALKADGGLSQITVPVQLQSMVQGQFTNYGGTFASPPIIPAIQNMQFPLAYWVVPIPLPFGEMAIQATDREISVLRARMNDAFAVTRQNISRLLYTNNSADPTYPNSFVDAYDDGTNVVTYGGINRTAVGNTALKGQYINAASWTSGSSSVGAVGLKRSSLSALLTYITDVAGGEMPTFATLNPADFSTLNADIISAEVVNLSPGDRFGNDTGIRSSFPNINIAGVPIFADHFVPKGSMIVNNTKYTNMYVSESAAFDFSGFQSLVPVNQMGYQGLLLFGYNVVSTKPSSGALVYGIGGAAW